METDFSNWTRETVDQLIERTDLSNQDKIKKLEKYIEWVSNNIFNLSSPGSLANNIYPPVNLLVGYYGLSESKNIDQIKEMMGRKYSDQISNMIANMSTCEFLSAITLIAFVSNLSTATIPNT